MILCYDDDRREALGIWKSRLGSGATYRALIEVFFKAGRLDYADAVCSLLTDSRPLYEPCGGTIRRILQVMLIV